MTPPLKFASAFFYSQTYFFYSSPQSVFFLLLPSLEFGDRVLKDQCFSIKIV